MVSALSIKNVGPISSAEIRFGDITVFVGPQATGKSIFLQTLKLLVDGAEVHRTMKRFGLVQSGHECFMDLYFGENMASIWSETSSQVILNGRQVYLSQITRQIRSVQAEIMFYIPAHRVTCLRDGMTRPFSDYRAGDPFVLRAFSETIHGIVQNGVESDDAVFPGKLHLSAALKRPILHHIFGEYGLRTDSSTLQRRLVLRSAQGGPLPYLVWSAGQRAFVPLLLGMYWLMPPSQTPRRKLLRYVVIEEPEMGLHPNGTGAVLGLVMELRRRGYRVCISTHSPHVLDVVWAMRFLRRNEGNASDALRLLDLKPTVQTKELADKMLGCDFRTYYFKRGGEVRDISELDPGSEDIAEGGWGGLTEFTGRVASVVSEVASRKSTH